MERNDNENIYDFSLLPPHITSIILSYLDFIDLKNAVQVCSLWYYASHHPLISKRLRLLIMKNIKMEIPEISQIIRPVDAIRISHIDFNTIEYLDFFKNFGKFIKILNIDFCTISVEQVFEILTYLKNLEEFAILECKATPLLKAEEGIGGEKNNFNEENRLKCIKNLGKIKHLTISPSTNNLLGFIPILRHTKNVVEFCLTNTWQSLPKDNDLMVDSLFEVMNYWNLVNLKTMKVEFISRNKNAAFYHKFLQLSNIQLKELRLMEKYEKEHIFNTSYYNQNFEDFCKMNKNLDILEIPSMNDRELFDISKCIPNLKHLEVGSMRVDRIQEIRNFKKLNVLHLCRFNIDPSEATVQLFSFKFDYLKTLWFELYIEQDICELISENCENLESLSLNLLTTDCQSIFKKLVKLKYLRLWFRMFRFHNFGEMAEPDNTNEFTIANLKELEYLEVNGFVTGMSANQIESLPKLKHSNHKFFNYDSNNENNFDEIYEDVEDVRFSDSPERDIYFGLERRLEPYEDM